VHITFPEDEKYSKTKLVSVEETQQDPEDIFKVAPGQVKFKYAQMELREE